MCACACVCARVYAIPRNNPWTPWPLLILNEKMRGLIRGQSVANPWPSNFKCCQIILGAHSLTKFPNDVGRLCASARRALFLLYI